MTIHAGYANNRQNGHADADRWIVRPRPRPDARLRLFCFPYAGGDASTFRTWPDALPGDCDVCLVQLPGRKVRFREPLLTDMSALLERLLHALGPYIDVPFAFFGHSLGALVSYALARELRCTGRPMPACLLLSSQRAPQLVGDGPRIADLPADQFIQVIRRFNGTPEEVLRHTEMMQIVLPIVRADFMVLESYEYTIDHALGCPISVFGGVDDNAVTRNDLEAWRQQTCAAFTLDMFPGGHFYLHNQQARVLRCISRELERAHTGTARYSDGHR